jgi:hypothetical protein
VEGHPFLVEGLAGPTPVECRALPALWGLRIRIRGESQTGERRKRANSRLILILGLRSGPRSLKNRNELTEQSFCPHEE